LSLGFSNDAHADFTRKVELPEALSLLGAVKGLVRLIHLELLAACEER
jgi:hypothetical protein